MLAEQSANNGSTDNVKSGHQVLDKSADFSIRAEPVNNLPDQVTAEPSSKPKYRY